MLTITHNKNGYFFIREVVNGKLGKPVAGPFAERKEAEVEKCWLDHPEINKYSAVA